MNWIKSTVEKNQIKKWRANATNCLEKPSKYKCWPTETISPYIWSHIKRRTHWNTNFKQIDMCECAFHLLCTHESVFECVYFDLECSGHLNNMTVSDCRDQNKQIRICFIKCESDCEVKSLEFNLARTLFTFNRLINA